jgi:hypothetical protein
VQLSVQSVLLVLKGCLDRFNGYSPLVKKFFFGVRHNLVRQILGSPDMYNIVEFSSSYCLIVVG